MKIRLELQTSGEFNHYKICLNEEKVGQLCITESSNYIYIDSIMIEQPYRRKGVGGMVIELLKMKHSVITGESNPLAINFWKKVGAEFEEDVTEECVDDLMELGVYPGFIIASSAN